MIDASAQDAERQRSDYTSAECTHLTGATSSDDAALKEQLNFARGFFVNDSFFVLTRAWHSLRLTTHSRHPCMSGDRLGERPGASRLRAWIRTSISLAHRLLLGGS